MRLGTKENLRVAAYCRISFDEEQEEVGSYETQKEFFEREIRAHEGWQFAGVYGDYARTGTQVEGRYGFKKLMRRAEGGTIDYILSKSISRFSRSVMDTLTYLRQLKALGIGVYFLEQGLDTMSISENLKWLYRKRAERGIFKAVSGRYFGFNTDDGNFTPDENAKYVRQMFQEYVSGKTTKEIAEGLEGVKNNKGKQVSASQVKSILANEVYKGDLHICKSVSRNVITGEPDAEQYGKYIEGHHEAIVGADLWAKAQKRLEAEARPRKDKSKEIDELEMDILAMAEDGWPLKEIAERLGTSVDVVRTCEKKLKAKGWLKEEMSKKQEIETRIETVYQAVKEGHQVGIGSFLGMKSGEVRYALTKLEKAGRVRKEDGAWVVA